MTTEPHTTHCNEGCGKSFTLNRFRTRKVKHSNEKLYFLCPHCKQEYVAYYASKETKRLQKQMRQLHVSMRGASLSDMVQLTRQEMELKAMIKQSMDEARAQSEG